MAKYESLGLLYRQAESDKAAEVLSTAGDKPKPCENSQPDVPVPAPPPQPERPIRARFGRRCEEPGGYTLDAPAILACMASAGALDHSHDFQALAARERVTRWLARQAPRGDGAAGDYQQEMLQIWT
jgi:hypothetical protein